MTQSVGSSKCDYIFSVHAKAEMFGSVAEKKEDPSSSLENDFYLMSETGGIDIPSSDYIHSRADLYTNVPCYSKTQVQTAINGFFPNANYLKIDGVRPLILSQTPNSKYEFVFFNMIFKLKIKDVICLVSDTEFKQDVSLDYFPVDTEKSRSFNEISGSKKWTLKCLDKRSNHRYVLQITKPSNETHDFVMHHYHNWKDHTVPEKDEMMSFLNHFDEETSGSQDDLILIHCKAGINRTGCLATLFAARACNLEIPKIVNLVRAARPCSVSEFKQYKFIVDIQSDLKKTSAQKSTEEVKDQNPKRNREEIEDRNKRPLQLLKI